MARIYYSLAGEGRGHAARVHTIVQHLREDHEVVVLAPHDAHDFLAPLWRGTNVRVERLPGLRFAYDGERVDYAKTARRAIRYLCRLPGLVRQLKDRLERERADLVICDFEPALARAARLAGVPLVSLDHQHFLTTSDLSSLPPGLRLWARTVGSIVATFVPRPNARIVSSFYSPGARRARRGLSHVGVLLRSELREARVRHERHLVAYFRRDVSPAVLDVLRTCGRDVRIYGLGSRPDRCNLRFREIANAGFAADLATCDAVLSTAGNQLVGEALSLGKPVFAMPEPGNREQEINAHFLARSGAGASCRFDEFDERRLARFLSDLELHRAVALAGDWEGTEEVLRLLAPFLGRQRAQARPALVLRPALEPA